jgi:NADH dehydrogenase/NADH:ubiquinone oxidoreductase subunit G
VITFKLNRKRVTVEEGTTILEAAREVGVYIPTLCYLEALEPAGACRLCIVELTVGGRVSHVASCVTPAVEGSVVRTDTEAVRRIRRTLLDLLLSRCPELPILKRLAEAAGLSGPSYPTENEDCFLCGLCVRACREIVGAEAIGFAERGVESMVLPPFAKPSPRCIGCGTCTTVCPARTFDLSKVERAVSMHGEGKDLRVRKCVICEEHY